MKGRKMAKEEDILLEAREAFAECQEAERENREAALDDLRFGRLGEQWPEAIRLQREKEGRPCLTIPRLNAFVRQVVNDARQNKPSIKVHPVDSGADRATAEIYDGLIRHIEKSSDADVAYDTATEHAVSLGWGYFRIGFDYAHDDSFDMDIAFHRVRNPFSIYGDPASTAADSSDWNVAFAVDRVRRKTFERQYKGAAAVNWEAEFQGIDGPWLDEDGVLIAEWWSREEYEKKLILLTPALGGEPVAIDEERLAKQPELRAAIAAGGLQPGAERMVRCWRVRRRLLTGAEVLSEEVWPGKYIPIVPVWGDEVDVEGRRVLRSLIRDAKDAQRMLNYWRSMATELVALAPKVPYIGPVGSFVTDAERWATANTVSWPYLEYDLKPGAPPPQRQPLDTGPAAGALHEAMVAADDIKAITGQYDASLGARSNETSGRAIIARQREGDVSTFHFIDNMLRAVRHAGRILIDLIPHVYNTPRILRILGEDGREATATIGRPAPVMGPDGAPVRGADGQPLVRMFDLGAGRYDLTVRAGPSFTTRREEAAAQMTELMRAFPIAAPIVGPELAKNLDWPGAERIAEKLEAMAPKPPSPAGMPGVPPQLLQEIQRGMAELQALRQENAAIKADRSLDAARIAADRQKEAGEQAIAARKLALEERKVALEERRALGVPAWG